MTKCILSYQYFKLFFISVFVIFSLFGLQSCSDDNNKSSEKKNKATVLSKSTTFELQNKSSVTQRQEPSKKNSSTHYPHTSLADWETIKNNGSIRIIVPHYLQHNENSLRNTSYYNNELNLILHFSEQHNLEPVIITVDEFSNLFSLLEDGLGDIVVANLSVTNSRKEKYLFSNPVAHSFEQLVVSNSFNKNISKKNLDNLKIGVRQNTSFWETLSAIKEKQPDINIIELNQKITEEEKLNKVITGELDAVIEDSNRLTLIQEYRQDVKAILNLTKERPIAWAVRQNNPVLLKQLNQFITTEKLLQHLPETRIGDLDKIKKTKQLRLITRNNASTYFLWKNQLMGFEYDLIKQFAEEQKLNLKVIVADNYEQMFEWLQSGYGDIISAGLIKNEERSDRSVLFTNPYLFVQEMVVQRNNDKTIHTLQDFKDRTFHVRKSSSYWHTLISVQNELKLQNIHFLIEATPENMETEEIIQSVLDDKFDLTLADSHIVAIEQSWNSNLKADFSVSEENGHRWILRKSDKILQSELNKFIKKNYKGLFYNVTFNKYFKNSRKLFDADKREANNKKISIYDELIKNLASEYHFDWRLIAAQVNKESQFNPKAKSWAGAKGLLQVMPRTAREVGISELDKPENGLKAGIKYMSWIRDQLSDELPADVKMWFTLSAYNAGLGHLKDARHLAVKKGLNPDRWFNHVEEAFLLLSKPEYHKKARYGYVRGIEPVTYVKHIQALYELYSKKHPGEA